ncbi:hypothetical protein QO034_13380 [Sedimentitalea sp. JM2-8]|uniref:MBG domain-containing protein n=1 Tax=Sedimentitalea xiamensis TaxID=3050037 RepID=A0ABT7FG79_9RHOB|nr:hypothetical protein [Sedimentitalea xiamensis]MDK3074108.1 hypothetical protein [Sedimentitalea xiamensis]
MPVAGKIYFGANEITKRYRGASLIYTAVAAAPVLSNLDDTGAPTSLSLDVDIVSNLYWSLDPVGTNPDGDTIVAGGITDSGGPDAISAGANVIAFDFSAIAAGTYDLSLVASNGGALSNVLRQEITLADAGTWAITGGELTLTVTDHPTPPSTPTVVGGELTLTVTG